MSVATVGLTTSTADRRLRAGQRVFMGLSGHALTAEERALIREIRPGGFVLFARNVAEPAQVRELNRELASLLPASHPPLRAVDQEGGRVQRIKAPATVWPPMLWVGQVGDLALTRAVAAAMARELRAMEFDLDFAPVADVLSNPKNPVIGDRAFGRTAATVSDQVQAFLDGLQGEGIIGSAKHFPGHGDTAQDSHLELPVVEREPPQLEEVELAPFSRAIRAGVGTVMSAHVLFPAWDEENPATMSERILRGILRRKLGFRGVLFSDDMEMKAVRGRFPLEIQLDRASRATVDAFLCCKDPELQFAAFEGLVRLQEEDPREDDRAKDSVKRLFLLRERFLLHRPPTPGLDVLGAPAHKELALRAEALGARMIALIAAAFACDALANLPERLQVAWVSPVDERVGASEGIAVVRATELRKLVTASGRDGAKVLQELGLVATGQAPDEAYKVVIFDVRSDRLCRPLDAAEGTTEAGLAVCPSRWQGRPPHVRRSAWSDCGYLLGSSGARGLDVYRIAWESASVNGFCVLPFERFLEEG